MIITTDLKNELLVSNGSIGLVMQGRVSKVS